MRLIELVEVYHIDLISANDRSVLSVNRSTSKITCFSENSTYSKDTFIEYR